MLSNRLKVCTFNSECDIFNNICCNESIYESKHITKIPDSLISAAIAVQILPNKADIYNIQNIKNKNVVEHLLKEIARVKHIMDNVHPYDGHKVTQISSDEVYPKDRIAYFTDIACMLNDFSGLCNDASDVKDSLRCCGVCGLDYVESKVLASVMEPTDYCSMINAKVLENNIINYKGIDEYNAYMAGSCLTLIKKSLCIKPKTRKIPNVNSLAVFFNLNGKRILNINKKYVIRTQGKDTFYVGRSAIINIFVNELKVFRLTVVHLTLWYKIKRRKLYSESSPNYFQLSKDSSEKLGPEFFTFG